MKDLIWKLILPLTIISFAIFTKYWYVSIVDGPNVYMYGFPLICVSDGIHTSMSLYFYIYDLIIDFLIYLIFWSFIVILFNLFFSPIKISKIIYLSLITLAIIFLLLFVVVINVSESSFYPNRNMEIEVINTNFRILGQ